MIVAIAGASFAVFKWIDTREDADADVVEWMKNQQTNQVKQLEWQKTVTEGIREVKLLVDSALVLAGQNNRAIYANRRAIIKSIQEDTSLSGDEMFERLKPYLDGIEELKKNSTWIPYDIE